MTLEEIAYLHMSTQGAELFRLLEKNDIFVED